MKPEEFVICSDFDDTMNELIPTWINKINELYGYNVSADQIVDWDLTQIFPSLTQAQICEPLHDPDFWYLVPAKDDAVYYIKKLMDEGFQFYVCTSTDYRFAKDKFDNCLYRLFPFICKEQVITTYNKQLMRCNILIDDGIHNIIGQYKGLLMDMPHNKSFKNPQVERVHNWKEIYDYIHELCK